ncbi:MAG: histidine phosphatase family protein [Candidatus Pelagibacter sp.]
MKKLKLFLLIIISLKFSNQALSEDKILESLQEGGKIIFIRHAYAPGGGDPDNFNINDCSTQRNLNDKGINQSKLIGEFFKTKKIKIDKVLSSEWCRCKDTAKFAFNDFETFDALNSFFSAKFAKNKKRQIKDLKNYIKNWKSDKNLILVTHYVVISSILNIAVSSGEIVISDKNYEIIGSIETM